MPTTVRELLNRILENLAEDQIADAATEINDDYQIQVLGFLNTILNEVQGAHNWRALQVTDTVVVSALSGTTLVDFANDRSRLVRVQMAEIGYEIPLVFDITQVNNALPLQEIPLPLLIYKEALQGTTSTSGGLVYFCLDNAAGDVLNLRTFPHDPSPRTVQLTLVVPQDRFVFDDLDVVVSIPTTALELGTTWYSLEDRGEELGVNSPFSEQRYREALDDAIARDNGEAGMTDLVPA